METENIQVLVRVRPLNEVERARGDHECVHVVEDGRTVKFIAPVGLADRRGSVSSTTASVDRGKTTVKALTFDGALAGSRQPDVFQAAKITQLLQDAKAQWPRRIRQHLTAVGGHKYRPLHRWNT